MSSICTGADSDAHDDAHDTEAFLSWEFPFAPSAAGSEGAPRAILSLAAAGDMKFRYAERNPVRENFFRSLGIPEGRALGIELQHSRNVVYIRDASEYGRTIAEAAAKGGADGILCGDPGLAVSVTVADCMPIWLYDEHSGSFGVLHSGWKGTGILRGAVSLLTRRFGSAPEDISVVLGPAIGPCCYRVPKERARSFAAEFGEACVRKTGGNDGREAFSLDLRKANLNLAEELGIRNLRDAALCTGCDARMGSYRRQGAASFTRMAAVCGRFSGRFTPASARE